MQKNMREEMDVYVVNTLMLMTKNKKMGNMEQGHRGKV